LKHATASGAVASCGSIQVVSRGAETAADVRALARSVARRIFPSPGEGETTPTDLAEDQRARVKDRIRSWLRGGSGAPAPADASSVPTSPRVVKLWEQDSIRAPNETYSTRSYNHVAIVLSLSEEGEILFERRRENLTFGETDWWDRRPATDEELRYPDYEWTRTTTPAFVNGQPDEIWEWKPTREATPLPYEAIRRLLNQLVSDR
jgi:hypothetical protein